MSIDPSTLSQPFIEAVKHLMAKGTLPNDLSSAQLRQIDAAIRRQSVFSANTAMEHYLEEIRGVVESIINPATGVSKDRETASNPHGLVTTGLSPATARAKLRDALTKFGYTPGEGIEGTIKDLSSDARLNLVINTNTQLAQGAGKFVQSNVDEDVVDLYPAWELVRYEDREKPRNWQQRWRIAAQVAGDPKAAAALELHGRMAALKSSGIWDALGDGAGGYDDTLGNPYPPFAFNSGMWCDDVSRDDAVDLGLISADETAHPARFNLDDLFSTPS
ncbi:MAG: hypothetical protein KGL39_17775 [Patescibacteria group bacterium]|nr:hypothetical protein [Patescibacteria group bacterium]